MKKGTPRELSRDQLAELKSLADLPDDAIDTSDAPELLDWSGAKRGLLYKSHPMPDEGYQTRINRALREYVEGQARRNRRAKRA